LLPDLRLSTEISGKLCAKLRDYAKINFKALMSDPKIPEPAANPEPDESFNDLLVQYERSHARPAEGGGGGLQGTVVAISGDSVFLDIGFKTEGILPLALFESAGETVQPGDKLPVTIKGRNAEGYYELLRGKIERPKDWAALEKAFAEKITIAGTVTGVVKGGFSVDVGVRAFMPASRSGVRETGEMEKLVGQEVRCRIIKLETTEEDVVVDSRVVAEEEEQARKQQRYSEIREGETLPGEVRSLADYGAFVDIGGVDALLHVADMAWRRVHHPADMLSVGQQVEVKVLKVDTGKRRISVGLKQLQPDPWDAAAQKYKLGERVRGAVTRVVDFGAFVELEPGIEGLIHVSEMSWSKKARKPADMVKPGETVDAVILGVNASDRRISLGLKQALGDPWVEVPQRFPAGSVVEGPITSLTKFGAFVQLMEGVEGMIHVGDISAEKRINHPQDVLRLGQAVKAQVLEIDTDRRRVRLGIKQLLPTSLEEYIAEHRVGNVITGRVVEISGEQGRVELGEGIQSTFRVSAQAAEEKQTPAGKPDLSSLSSMLQARWKGGAAAGGSKPEPVRAGQVRSFRIAKLDPAAKTIELELA
jgi:small subunit ribosomal protein S1